MLQDRDRSFVSTSAEPTSKSRSAGDRRGEKRHIALLRVALLHVGGTRELCVVKNISPSGLSARVYRKLAIGDEVEIEFRSGELLKGSVVWEGNWDIGILFPEPIDIGPVLASRRVTGTGRGRNLPRINVNVPARFMSGPQSFGGQLKDILQSGAKVRTESAIPVHAKVVLILPDLPPTAGVVRWGCGTEIGISFNEYISFELVARWIQALSAGCSPSAATSDSSVTEVAALTVAGGGHWCASSTDE
jgi:hypothetical protein